MAERTRDRTKENPNSNVRSVTFRPIRCVAQIEAELAAYFDGTSTSINSPLAWNWVAVPKRRLEGAPRNTARGDA
jgi:hypothetical protein